MMSGKSLGFGDGKGRDGLTPAMRHKFGLDKVTQTKASRRSGRRAAEFFFVEKAKRDLCARPP